MTARVPLIRSLGRSQVSALFATGVDFAAFFALVELWGVGYVAAAVVAPALGAVTNFLLNRYWSFEAEDAPWRAQAGRYAVVSVGSLVLNAVGVYAFTEYAGMLYGYSKVATALSVALFFNFPLQRGFVFR